MSLKDGRARRRQPAHRPRQRRGPAMARPETSAAPWEVARRGRQPSPQGRRSKATCKLRGLAAAAARTPPVFPAAPAPLGPRLDRGRRPLHRLRLRRCKKPRRHSRAVPPAPKRSAGRAKGRALLACPAGCMRSKPAPRASLQPQATSLQGKLKPRPRGCVPPKARCWRELPLAMARRQRCRRKPWASGMRCPSLTGLRASACPRSSTASHEASRCPARRRQVGCQPLRPMRSTAPPRPLAQAPPLRPSAAGSLGRPRHPPATPLRAPHQQRSSGPAATPARPRRSAWISASGPRVQQVHPFPT
mmetsp:Transcript_13000/g.37419  ORF Transcript_13000/g.37419 Transcript_13000/m.37419 type:complete len:304 (-) Transcript_13000:1162-2073(-)